MTVLDILNDIDEREKLVSELVDNRMIGVTKALIKYLENEMLVNIQCDDNYTTSGLLNYDYNGTNLRRLEQHMDTLVKVLDTIQNSS